MDMGALSYHPEKSQETLAGWLYPPDSYRPILVDLLDEFTTVFFTLGLLEGLRGQMELLVFTGWIKLPTGFTDFNWAVQPGSLAIFIPAMLAIFSWAGFLLSYLSISSLRFLVRRAVYQLGNAVFLRSSTIIVGVNFNTNSLPIGST